jgi:hypothetical protein
MGALTSLVPPRSPRPQGAGNHNQPVRSSFPASANDRELRISRRVPSFTFVSRLTAPRHALSQTPGARAFAADGINSPAATQPAQTDRYLTRSGASAPLVTQACSNSTPPHASATPSGFRRQHARRAPALTLLRRPVWTVPLPCPGKGDGIWRSEIGAGVGRRSSQWGVAAGQLIEVAPHPPGVAVGRAAHGRGGLCLDGPAKVVIQSVERDLRNGSCDALDDCG